jgi:adiponectin receptor
MVELDTPASPPDSRGQELSDKAEDLWHSLVHWNDLPHWRQDNHYIHSNYRQASYSYSRSWQSVLHWHNESVNIWSHLIPATLSLPFAVVLYKVLKPRYYHASLADVIAMSCFFAGAAFCLGISASFHTLSNHSPSVARFWNQLDYAGISLLIAGSFVPSVYYGFWCHPIKQWTYWIMVRIPPIAWMRKTERCGRYARWVSLAPPCRSFHGSELRRGGHTERSCSLAWASLQSSPSSMD